MARSRVEIAEELLGCALEDGQFAKCPGEGLHKRPGGARDFRVCLDGAPTGYCFHTSCLGAVAEFNTELRRAIWREEHGHLPRVAPRGWEGVAAEPQGPRPDPRQPMDMRAVDEFIRGVPVVDEGWLARRSAVDVSRCTTRDFLEGLYTEGERVLIFTRFTSQGDFIFWKGKGTYRLARERGVQAAASELPRGGDEGVWFLCQPVSGKWAINSKLMRGDAEAVAKWTRRSECNVTGWRFFVLESDTLDPRKWLRVVVNLPLCIVAIYTSGGRSIHVLVKEPVGSKAEWDAFRNSMRPLVCSLGADPAALSAVRLSRLPGCFRKGKEQKLLYFAPGADSTEIRLLREFR